MRSTGKREGGRDKKSRGRGRRGKGGSLCSFKNNEKFSGLLLCFHHTEHDTEECTSCSFKWSSVAPFKMQLWVIEMSQLARLLYKPDNLSSRSEFQTTRIKMTPEVVL